MKRPYDDRGRFVPLNCPASDCGNGSLQPVGDGIWDDGIWQCDGLAEPEHDDLPLEPCGFTHVDGEAYTSRD